LELKVEQNLAVAANAGFAAQTRVVVSRSNICFAQVDIYLIQAHTNSDQIIFPQKLNQRQQVC